MLALRTPLFFAGEVVHGFGRGSRSLGIPTANLCEAAVEKLSDAVEDGVYCGFARIASGSVYPMVMSIGKNPFYHNLKRSIEAHILHLFPTDFYGDHMRLLVLCYLRPMRSFQSTDELISAINLDIEQSKQLLSSPDMEKFMRHEFLADCKESKI